MDVSRGLTVGSHHEAPYRWIPTEDGEDRAIVGGVVLNLLMAAPGGVAVSWTASDPAGLGSISGLGRWFGVFQR